MIVTINSNSSAREIDIALQKLQKSSAKNQKKSFNAHKYCGVIKLKDDPLAIQKAMRNEWQ